MNLRIATRKSRLAQTQADIICKMLQDKYGIDCEKVLIETTGDMILDVSLDKIGGKALFVKDIEIAMLNMEADAAVHSMKDVPYEIPEGFEISAIPLREDPRDAFISLEGQNFCNIRQGARVGTSSLRRSSQLKFMRPDIEIIPVRGNVQTRIAKMEKEKMDGIILAAAGLKRLGMESIITDYFDPLEFVPAVGQGALGIETLKGSTPAGIIESLDSNDIRICVEAERSFMRRLDGGCHTTVGAYAQLEGSLMHIVGIFEVSGRLVKKDTTGKNCDGIMLGKSLAEEILKA